MNDNNLASAADQHRFWLAGDEDKAMAEGMGSHPLPEKIPFLLSFI